MADRAEQAREKERDDERLPRAETRFRFFSFTRR